MDFFSFKGLTELYILNSKHLLPFKKEFKNKKSKEYFLSSKRGNFDEFSKDYLHFICGFLEINWEGIDN